MRSGAQSSPPASPKRGTVLSRSGRANFHRNGTRLGGDAARRTRRCTIVCPWRRGVTGRGLRRMPRGIHTVPLRKTTPWQPHAGDLHSIEPPPTQPSTPKGVQASRVHRSPPRRSAVFAMKKMHAAAAASSRVKSNGNAGKVALGNERLHLGHNPLPAGRSWGFVGAPSGQGVGPSGSDQR
ncbi:hypothetical protein ZHAS_00010983 [Anopheles sinensis]|uniref:Uncharacterized protein n=1 Tax=Anopheles sinensis TaxID=74873 RepID=A0A084VZ11_ANOSI|nr:hypothetical protein ZHAS_00010983 [Anopheles sinensis]